jgi:RNA polymerase-binding transcription factor DksA
MKHLSEEELNDLRDMLEAERATLGEELATYGRKEESTGQWEGSAKGGEGEEADQGDIADNIDEMVTNVSLVDEFKVRERELVDALARMDNGTYGFCDTCKTPIPFERLEANPAARTCIAHG